jgi:RNA polymerase sigma-54 factor
MKQSLQLRTSQHLALTPQLQQSIRLLQLSTLELHQELETLLIENPMLERVDDPMDNAVRLLADGAINNTSTTPDAGMESAAQADNNTPQEATPTPMRRSTTASAPTRKNGVLTTRLPVHLTATKMKDVLSWKRRTSAYANTCSNKCV